MSFISDYDFNFDIEYLNTTIDCELLAGDEKKYEVKGRIPGLSIGMRSNYWLTDNVGLALGGSLLGIKGTINDGVEEYYYRDYGGMLSAGPVFQLGKMQLLLAYKYDVDHVSIENKNKNGYGLNENSWEDNYALKAMASFRF